MFIINVKNLNSLEQASSVMREKFLSFIIAKMRAATNKLQTIKIIQLKFIFCKLQLAHHKNFMKEKAEKV